MPNENVTIPELDINILKRNIKTLMKDKNITQEKLANALGMIQSNVSKALNENDSKCFTVMQIFKIAEYFDVSIDWLVGKEKKSSFDISNKSIAFVISELLKNDKITFFEHEATEYAFVPDYDESDFLNSYKQEKIKSKYYAFYFHNYWQLPNNANDIEEYEYHEECSQIGNDTNYNKLNEFIKVFIELKKSYDAKAFSKEAFDSIVLSLINGMQ